MTSPRISYDISDLVPGAAPQAVHGATRPLCAFTTAIASWARGNTLRGSFTAIDEPDVEEYIRGTFADSGVPEARAKNWVSAINGETLFDMTGAYPAYTEMKLSQYQRDALSRCTVAGGVLALSVGLGKTVTAVNGACYAADITAASSTRCWILAPLVAMGAWKPYVATLKKSFDTVEIISVDSAHKLLGTANTGGVLIIDEAHTLGTMTARRTQAAHRLRPLFDVCFCLTGTLLHAGVEKCLSIQDLAVPGLSLFSSHWKAGEHFKCLVKKRLGRREVHVLEKPSAMKVPFLEYLARSCVSLDKDSPDVRDVAEIPNQKLITEIIGKPWPKMETEVARLVDAVIASGSELPHAAEIMHQLARDGLEAKLDKWIDDNLGSDEPWVVFAHYLETLDRIEGLFTAAGCTYVRVDGSTPQRLREEAERRFQVGEVQFFLGQTSAAGMSINLFKACKSVCFDRSWKAVDYAQALGRTCRRGQTRECLHYDYVANPLQVAILNRLRDGADFNAELTVFQDTKRAILAVRPGVILP